MIEIMYFGAEWCAPCKNFAPTMKTIADDNEDVSVIKIDVEDNSELSSEYNIRSIPALVMTRDSIEVGRMVGNRNLSEIQSMINIQKLV